MAFVVADRVKETTTTVGTGAVALAGAVFGFRTFASGIGNSNTTYYTIASQTANEWEVGYGTLDATSANLARTTVLASSNGGSLVTFSAGTKDVFVTQSAARTLVQASGGTTTNGVLYYTGSGVATGGSALTFDGSALTLGGTFAATRFAVNANPINTTSTSQSFARFQSTGADFYIGTESSTAGGYFPSSTAYAAVLYNSSSTPMQFYTAGGLRATLDTSGNLGIGTSSPSYKLDVAGDIALKNNATYLYSKTSGGTVVRMLGINSGNTAYVGPIDSGPGDMILNASSSSANIQFYATGSEQMRLTTTGLGIGTSSPSTKLEVSVADAVVAQRWVATTGRLRLRPYVDATSGALFESTNTAESAYLPLSLYGSSVRMGNGAQVIIDSSGNLGIGTSSPGATLDVNGTTRIRSDFYVYGTGDRFNVFPQAAGSGAWLVSTNNANSAYSQLLFDGSPLVFNVAGTERMRLNSSGNLGIGTTSPSSRLDVTGGNIVVDGFFSGYGIAFRQGFETTANLKIYASDPGGFGRNGALFLTAYDGICFGTGSNTFQERMRIDNAGNVGIGTSSPAQKLDVVGDARISNTSNSIFTIQATYGAGSSILDFTASGSSSQNTRIVGGTGSTSNLSFWTGGGSLSEKMRLNSSGNLGIGTSSPITRLDINTGSINMYSGRIGYSPDADVFTSSSYTYANYGLTINTALIGLSGYYGVAFYTAATERMRLDNSGNLGLGVTPSAWGAAYPGRIQGLGWAIATPLDGGTDTSAFATNAYNSAGSTWNYRTNASAVLYQQFSGAHRWYNAPSGTAGNAISFTQAMTLDASGNLIVGGTSALGTTSGRGNITVNGTSSILSFGISGSLSGYVLHDGTDLWINNALAGAQRFYTNGSERARISSTGGFSVGTTADPGAGAIYATGNITAYYSDDRLKNRLGSIEKALDKIDQLSGFYYEANETAQQLGYTPKREVGVSAQDVQKVMPEIVSPAPIDPEYLTISYERLTPLLIEAIKELRAEVRALKK